MSNGGDQLNNHCNEPPLPDKAVSHDFTANLEDGPVTVTYHASSIQSLETPEARAYFKEMLRRDSLRSLKAVLVFEQLDSQFQLQHLIWADSPYALYPALLDQVCDPQVRLADMWTDLVRDTEGRMARRLFIGAYGEENVAQALDFMGFIVDMAGDELADKHLEIVAPDGSRA